MLLQAVTLEIVCGVGDWPVRLLIGMPKEDHRAATLKENSVRAASDFGATLAATAVHAHAPRSLLRAFHAPLLSNAIRQKTSRKWRPWLWRDTTFTQHIRRSR